MTAASSICTPTVRWFPAGTSVFAQVPEMTRGRGVRLQRFKDGGLSDVKTFKAGDGLTWIDSAGRIVYTKWDHLQRDHQPGAIAIHPNREALVTGN